MVNGLPKMMSLIIMSALLLGAASAACACAPQIQKGTEKGAPVVKGDALVLVRLPEDVYKRQVLSCLAAAAPTCQRRCNQKDLLQIGYRQRRASPDGKALLFLSLYGSPHL